MLLQMALFHSFYGSVLLHCVYVPNRLYPFICRRTLRLLLHLGYCKQAHSLFLKLFLPLAFTASQSHCSPISSPHTFYSLVLGSEILKLFSPASRLKLNMVHDLDLGKKPVVSTLILQKWGHDIGKKENVS